MLVLMLALCFPALAQADRYRVDVIVFLDHGSVGDEQPVALTAPQLSRGINPDDAGRLASAGIHVLPATDFGLQSEWQHLRNSRQFQPLIRLSWVQTAASSGTRLSLVGGRPVTLADGSAGSTVSGSVALYTGTFLHLDADLSYTFDGDGGTPEQYRLDEVRRVKFNEVHYLDSPRVGLLARVTKVP